MAAPASQESKSPNRKPTSNDVGPEEYAIIHLEPSPNNFKMSKIPTDQIYKEKMLSSTFPNNDYKIKTVKKTFPLGNTRQDLLLIDREVILKYQNKYKFLHVGLVQFSITVLTRLVPNSSLTICLTDERHANVQNSILVAFETNASTENVINFNLYPNISYFLCGLRETESLILTIQPQDCQVKDRVKAFSVTYRMCYKLMKADFKPKSLIRCPKLELNTKKSSILVPVADGNRVVLQRRKE